VCRICGKVGTDEAPISFRGLCSDDGIRRAVENNVGLHTKSGPGFDRWKARMRELIGDD